MVIAVVVVVTVTVLVATVVVVNGGPWKIQWGRLPVVLVIDALGSGSKTDTTDTHCKPP